MIIVEGVAGESPARDLISWSGAAGRADLDQNASSPCAACAEGRFGATEGLTLCSSCAEGRFAAAVGSSTCTQCTAGYYSVRLIPFRHGIAVLSCHSLFHRARGVPLDRSTTFTGELCS